MANITHTPGPWFVAQASWDEETHDVRWTLDGVKEANVADARLIAAAPELLDALENLLIAIGMGWDLEGVIDASRAAIAKAKGEV